MKRLVKRLILIALVLYVAVHFFDFDLGGAVSAVKTVAFDAVEKVIPGSRAQFEDIDAQISAKIVKSGTAQSLTSAAKAAVANASRVLSRAWIQTKRFAARYGVNLDFSWLTFRSLTGRRSGGSGGGSYAFDYENLNMAELSALRQKFIDYSMTLRGTPYVLGSENPERGLDCSAFVRYAAKNGINVKLPRTAREQYAAVERIGASEREPGDLVFFRRFGKIDHVGIYLGRYEGSGSLHGREIFINAASEGPRTGVVVSALDEPYWRRHYSSSGRFLPSYKEVAETVGAAL